MQVSTLFPTILIIIFLKDHETQLLQTRIKLSFCHHKHTVQPLGEECNENQSWQHSLY